MFISTIIPTVNRPTLSRSVESVLQQDFPRDEFEIIVVNDSGQPLTETDWQPSSQVRIIETNRRNRSVARNAGAAIAKGKYLHFLDDDDWMMPGAFTALWKLARRSKAAWLYGAYRLVDNSGDILKEVKIEEEGNCLIKLMAGEWIPLQASFLMADSFFSVGGFTALQLLLGGSEDIDLSRKMNFNFELAYTPAVVATIRAGWLNKETTTTDYSNNTAQLRQSREIVLNSPGAFYRMRSSANEMRQDSEYWNGQVVYYYLASMFHNFFRQKRIFTAISRGSFSLAAFLLAGKNLFKTNFWRGIREGYAALAWR